MTMGIVLPSDVGILVAAAMPVHSGLFRVAVARDMQEQIQDTQLIRWLNDTDKALRAGRLNNISVLTKITSRLNATQFGNQMLARARARLSISLIAENDRSRPITAASSQTGRRFVRTSTRSIQAGRGGRRLEKLFARRRQVPSCSLTLRASGPRVFLLIMTVTTRRNY